MKALKSALAVAGVTTAAVFAFATPAFAGGGDDIDQDTKGNFGALNGNQLALPIELNLDISCNAIAVIGLASSYCD